MVVRPSALQIAEVCTMAPALALQFPETSKWATRGTELHLEIATRVAVSLEAKAALAWLSRRVVICQEEKVQLHDPDTGELLTEGTVDAACEETDEDGRFLVVVDWKSGQAAYVTDPDKNLQLHAYALALAAHYGYDRYQVVVAFLRDTGVEEVRSRVISGDTQWVMLNRIRAIQGRSPEANPGPHCSDCFQSVVCASFRERARLALTLLPKDVAPPVETEEGTPEVVLSDEQATALVQRMETVEEALEQARLLAEAHVRRGGTIKAGDKVWGPTSVNGRRTADVEALVADGLTKYIRKGRPYERWTWKRAG